MSTVNKYQANTSYSLKNLKFPDFFYKNSYKNELFRKNIQKNKLRNEILAKHFSFTYIAFFGNGFSQIFQKKISSKDPILGI